MVDKTSTEELRKEPAFAVICSFFNKFGSVLGLKPQSFSRLETILTFDDEGRVERDLIDLHVKLMRKAGAKGVAHSRWENALAKYCAIDPDLRVESFTLERFGYAHSPLGTKLNILKCLCDRQFDWNPKFKEQVSSCTSSELRLLPVGVDSVGKAYWYQLDSDLNLRIYSEEPDDSSGATWVLQAKGREDLSNLITMLETGSTDTKPEESTAEDKKAPKADEEEGTKDTDGVKNEEAKEDDEKPPAPDEKPEKPDESSTSKKSEENDGVRKEATSDNDEEEKESSEKNEEETTETPKLCVKNKKGTFMDTYQSIEDTLSKKGKQTGKKSKKGRVAKLRDEVENGTDGSSTPPDKSGEESQDIPDALKPFIERGIQPRRSARNAAKQVTQKVEEAKESSAEEEAEEPEEKSASSAGEEESSGTEDSDYRPLSLLRSASGKRRRRKKEELSGEEESEDEEESVRKERRQATDNSFCKSCDKSSNWEVLLLCDKCDDAWHTWCLKPALWYVPDDDWFCPKCQHGMLIEKLNSALLSLDEQLKKKATEDKRKERQQERLKREMAFIGVSLNNIIKPETDDNKENASSEEEDDDDSETERRKAKKKKRPIVPIALSRTKRETKRVDYTFSGYDELVQEALEDIQDSSSKPKYSDPARPTGGLGRGKDMANILQAEAGRDSSREKDEEGKAGKPPTAISAPKTKKKSKLTDINIDEMTESDTDEFQVASESEFEPEEDEPESDDEYLPEARARGTRRSARINGPTQSDEDFVRSGSSLSESDYRKKKKKVKAKADKKKRRSRYEESDSGDSIVEKAKRKRWGSDTDSSSEEEYRPSKAKKKKRPVNSKQGRSTRGKKINYRALDVGSGSEEEENSDAAPVNGGRDSKNDRPTGAYRGKRKAKASQEDDYKPESEESDADAKDDGSGSNNEDDEAPSAPKSKRLSAKKARIESSSEEEDGEEQEEQEEETPEDSPKDVKDEPSPEEEEEEEDTNDSKDAPTESQDADSGKTDTEIKTELSEKPSASKSVSVIQQSSAPPPTQGFQPVIPRGNSGVGTPPHSMSPFRPTGAVGTPPPQVHQLLQPRNPSPVPLRPQASAYYSPGTVPVRFGTDPASGSSSPFASLQPMKPLYPVPMTVYPGGMPVPGPPHWVPGTGAPPLAVHPAARLPQMAPAAVYPHPGQITQPPTVAPGSAGGAESLSDVLSSAMQDEF